MHVPNLTTITTTQSLTFLSTMVFDNIYTTKYVI